MAITPIESYTALCSQYVPEQYKRSARLLALVDSVLVQCDDLESAFLDMMLMLDPMQAVGPALDYIGALVGVDRVPGQTDEVYRLRILDGNHSVGLPSPESLRDCLQLVTGRNVGLFPVWPAGMYVVVDGTTAADISAYIRQYMTSGCALGRGTFLCGEYMDEGGVEFGYLVLEDTGLPLVIDYHVPDTIYYLVDSSGAGFVDDIGNFIIALDYDSGDNGMVPTA